MEEEDKESSTHNRIDNGANELVSNSSGSDSFHNRGLHAHDQGTVINKTQRSDANDTRDDHTNSGGNGNPTSLNENGDVNADIDAVEIDTNKANASINGTIVCDIEGVEAILSTQFQRTLLNDDLDGNIPFDKIFPNVHNWTTRSVGQTLVGLCGTPPLSSSRNLPPPPPHRNLNVHNDGVKHTLVVPQLPTYKRPASNSADTGRKGRVSNASILPFYSGL